MKKFKKFAKNRWHSIPLGAIAIALIVSVSLTGIAFAATTAISNLWTSPTITVTTTPLAITSDFTGDKAKETGSTFEFTVTLKNPNPVVTYEGVLVELCVYDADDTIAKGDVILEYYEVLDSSWHTWGLDVSGDHLTGLFGPPTTGFPVSGGYDVTTFFRVTFNTPGVYHATAQAVH